MYRYKKGYKNVIDKACELNSKGIDSQLAIETSGHGALKENHMLDDGAYMAMKVSTTDSFSIAIVLAACQSDRVGHWHSSN
jgi:Phosphoglucomutase/phosphomannomutase, alpha/beta/alpha domain III